MSDVKNTIESKKVAESNKFSEEYQKQVISMLERLIPKEIQKVDIVDKIAMFANLKLARATTAEISKQGRPSIEFKNPLDAETKVKTISLIPNTSFKTKGMVEVLIDGVSVFSNNAVADFTDISSLNIELAPQGKTIESAKSVEIFIWSPDGTSVSLAATCLFSKVKEG